MLTGRIIFAAGVLAAAGWAQSSAGVTGPVTGFIYDAQMSAVRPMLGIPGAAYLGPVVARGLGAASVSPDGSLALAVQQNGKLMVYSGLRSATPTPLTVSGAIAGVDHFAWAADSSAAAVYSSGSAQGQIITVVAATPEAGASIDLSSLTGLVTALAFDGKRLIVGVSSAETGGIYLANAAGGAQRVAAATSPSAIAVANGSLYFSDSQAQQIVQVQTYAGTPAAMVFANDSSIASPAGLQVSTDGQRLYVANAGNRKLGVYDIASQTPIQTVDLTFAPTRLDRFGDSSVFVMNGTGHGPVYVARDGAAGKAAVFFVPAPVKPHGPKTPIRPL